MSNFLNFIKDNKEKTFFIFILFWLLVIAQIETYSQLTTSGTFAATMRLAIPILLAGLGGIFSERSGVVNIGLEGMMIMGTWFGAWAAWLYGPWWGVAAGIFGGLILLSIFGYTSLMDRQTWAYKFELVRNTLGLLFFMIPSQNEFYIRTMPLLFYFGISYFSLSILSLFLFNRRLKIKLIKES